MASFFTKVKNKITARYRLDVNRVVQEYDAFLQEGLVTTSSFQDILDGKLNRKRRALQLLFMLYVSVYLIPKYCFVSLLYFQDEETRIHYQYILADYNEEMGMLGKILNFGCIIFAIALLVNDIVMRKCEGQGSLEFLTDWLKRIPKKTSIEDGDTDEITAPGSLDNQSRHELISSLHYKLMFARVMTKIVATADQLCELIAFLVFLYKRKPDFWITCLGLWNSITMLTCSKMFGYHLHSLYLSYVVTTDYFKYVIKNLVRRVENLKIEQMTDQNMTRILDDYDVMMNDFKKYNRVLKPLLRNLVYFYIFGLTSLFVMLTIKAETWILMTMIFVAGGYSFMMLSTGVYVSQLNANVGELHNTLASFCARYAEDHKRLSLKCMFRLKHIIQELGSPMTDGQFVIGLRDGEGAATSRMEIFDMTMETISNTLMILGFISGMEDT